MGFTWKLLKAILMLLGGLYEGVSGCSRRCEEVWCDMIARARLAGGAAFGLTRQKPPTQTSISLKIHTKVGLEVALQARDVVVGVCGRCGGVGRNVW